MLCKDEKISETKGFFGVYNSQLLKTASNTIPQAKWNQKCIGLAYVSTCISMQKQKHAEARGHAPSAVA